MLIVLNDEIFNMGKFDSIKSMDKEGCYPYRIAFFRKQMELDYASFKSKSDMDNEWARICETVSRWYG